MHLNLTILLGTWPEVILSAWIQLDLYRPPRPFRGTFAHLIIQEKTYRLGVAHPRRPILLCLILPNVACMQALGRGTSEKEIRQRLFQINKSYAIINYCLEFTSHRLGWHEAG